LSNRSTTKAAKKLTQTLNALTGGNTVRPGMIDIAPDAVDHWVEFLTGGAGAFANRVIDNAVSAPEVSESVLQGNWDEIPTHDLAFVRRIYGRTPEYLTASRYYNARQNLRILRKEAEMVREKNGPKAFRDYRLEHRRLLSVSARLGETDRQLRSIQRKINAARSSGKRPELIERLEALERRKMEQFLAEYNEARDAGY
jgi:hypothetical protein